MTEENSTAEVVTDPAPVETEPTTVPDTENQTTAIEGESQPPEQKTEEQQSEKPSRAELRIKQLIAKQKAMEQELSYLRGVSDGKSGGSKPQVQSESSPKIDDFETYDDFIVAKTKYEVQKDLQQQQQRVIYEQIDSQYKARIEKASEEDPYILEIASDQTLPINAAMAQIIKASDQSAGLLRYLDQNRDEATKIAGMDPLSAARAMVRLEFKIESQKVEKPRKVSHAPAPITPVVPKGETELDLEKLPIGEFMKVRNKQVREGR